jgi:hypothetical protein
VHPDPAPALNAPSLNAPADNETLNGSPVTFSWSAIRGCTFSAYTLHVRTDTDMDSTTPHIFDQGYGGLVSDAATLHAAGLPDDGRLRAALV